jgi:hypothetical protein
MVEKSSKIAEIIKRIEAIENHVSTLTIPVAKKLDPNKNFFERLSDKTEGAWLTRLVSALAGYLLFITLLGFWFDWNARTEERTARAWQALAMKASGNSGKAEALNFLHKSVNPIVGINLGSSNPESASYLSGVELKGAQIWNANLDYAQIFGSISDTHFTWLSSRSAFFQGSFENVHYVWADMRRAAVIADIENSKDEVTFADVIFDNGHYLGRRFKFENVSMRCVIMDSADFSGNRFYDVNLSGAVFEYAELDEDGTLVNRFPIERDPGSWNSFERAWYFSDNPPTGLPVDVLNKHFRARDRAEYLRSCRANEPMAFTSTPFADADSMTPAVKTGCISIALQPDKCTPLLPRHGGSDFEEIYWTDPE